MSKFSVFIAIFAWLLTGPAHALDGGRYGDVRLAMPAGTPRGYVVLFSDAGGWTAADQARLESLAKVGALAVGVDTDAYLARVGSVEAPCDQLVGDAEGLSRQLQREHGGAEYFFPILTGVGEGGALAGAILAQAPPATLGGGVSLDPWAVVQTRHGFCARVPSDGDQPHYWRVPILNQFWSVALTPATPEISLAHFETLQTLSPHLAVQTLSVRTPDQTLASLVAPHLIPDDFSRVDGLPLVELPASSPSRLMAVFLSGDGGWRDIDKTIAENLQSLGVSVVGWDSVRYFWQTKTPEQTAADLSAVIQAYSAKWHADKIALIGFSFGADALPFAYDRLRPSLKRQIAMISLLSVGRAADWEIRVVGWLGVGPSAQATPLAPAIREIPAKIIQCFYGDQDSGSYCPDLVNKGAEVIEKKGIHHFDGNYVYMAQQILDGFKRRISN